MWPSVPICCSLWQRTQHAIPLHWTLAEAIIVHIWAFWELVVPNLGISWAQIWAFDVPKFGNSGGILGILLCPNGNSGNFGNSGGILGISCAQIWAFWTVEGLGTWQEPLIRSWVGGGADLETSWAKQYKLLGIQIWNWIFSEAFVRIAYFSMLHVLLDGFSTPCNLLCPVGR